MAPTKRIFLLLSPLLFLSLTLHPQATGTIPNKTHLQKNKGSALNSSYPNMTTTCHAKERSALLRFKSSLIDPSQWLSSWRGQDCCQWVGISCHGLTRHVTVLDLRSPEFCTDYSIVENGDPESYTPQCLSGELSPALLDLKRLQYLDLSNNNFNGIPIPDFIGSMKSLRHLDLSFASFGGSVPYTLGNLSMLQYLDLTVDSYSSQSLRVSDLDWISSLPSLTNLRLVGVNLSKASHHWPNKVLNLTSLVELSLVGCGLSDFPNHYLRLSNFASLSTLDLSSNQFNSSIPRWVFEIGSLAELRVSESTLVGSLPPIKEASLCNLRKLDLSFNNLTGDIAALALGLLGCPNSTIEEIDFTENKFHGNLPDSLGFLEYLRVLRLSQNSFSGPIPWSIGNLSRLEELELSFNEMNGTIPESIGRLSELTKLSLLSNSWEGAVSEYHFRNLTKVTDLSISSEKAGTLRFRISSDWVPGFDLKSIRISNCVLGPDFPEWLEHQKKLSSIVLSNAGISGPAPDWLWAMSEQIDLLELSGNRITGKLPSPLSFNVPAEVKLAWNQFEGQFPLWTGVGRLSLRNNRLYGEIPNRIDVYMSKLRYLDAANNSLSGKIPSSISKLKDLVILDLSRNFLSGKVIFGWAEMPNLKTLDLSRNNLFGPIPRKMCSIFPSIEWLKLRDNNISGKLYSSSINCSRLVTFDLGENQLDGPIPNQGLGNLSRLSELILRGNNFAGKFPGKLCTSPNLHVLDFANNRLLGSIPRCVSLMVGMKSYGQYYQIPIEFQSFYSGNVEVVTKDMPMEYDELIPLVNVIDLSGNNFSGEIPEEITSLAFLGALNLSQNRFSGRIPENISKLNRLETLDLSCNRIFGAIPSSMTSMTLLAHLNLSHNNLSGQIPYTNQFRTYDVSAFEGNPGLCGPPLNAGCSGSSDWDRAAEKDESEVDDEDELIDFWFYVSMGLGFLVGFWLFCGCLVIKKSWRYAYFGFFDRVKDKIFLFVVLRVARVRRKL